MNKTIITVTTFIVFAVGAFIVISNNDSHDEQMKDTNNTSTQITYSNISAQELSETLASRDVFLLDVHVPEQDHIIGTDEFIDYTEIAANESKLPTNKDTEIVVYCRSGSMSKISSEALVELGYTNVKNLDGGVNSWINAGYKVDSTLKGTFDN